MYTVFRIPVLLIVESYNDYTQDVNLPLHTVLDPERHLSKEPESSPVDLESAMLERVPLAVWVPVVRVAVALTPVVRQIVAVLRVFLGQLEGCRRLEERPPPRLAEPTDRRLPWSAEVL